MDFIRQYSCSLFRKRDNDILNADWLNTKPFVPPVTEGKVIKVYDGDTITIAAKLPYANSPVYKFSVRLSGIDCSEIKSDTDKEKELAKQARDALNERIHGKMVSLRNVSTEKYGRLLADVYIDGECLNTWMLVNKYAIKYNGGTKKKPLEWA
jgi:micrococcal nuclease